MHVELDVADQPIGVPAGIELRDLVTLDAQHELNTGRLQGRLDGHEPGP